MDVKTFLDNLPEKERAFYTNMLEEAKLNHEKLDAQGKYDVDTYLFSNNLFSLSMELDAWIQRHPINNFKGIKISSGFEDNDEFVYIDCKLDKVVQIISYISGLEHSIPEFICIDNDKYFLRMPFARGVMSANSYVDNNGVLKPN